MGFAMTNITDWLIHNSYIDKQKHNFFQNRKNVYVNQNLLHTIISKYH